MRAFYVANHLHYLSATFILITFRRNFLTLEDFTRAEIEGILDLAVCCYASSFS